MGRRKTSPVDARTARQLAKAGRAVREAKAKRDSLITQAWHDGASFNAIAKLVGLSTSGVAVVVNRTPYPAADETRSTR